MKIRIPFAVITASPRRKRAVLEDRDLFRLDRHGSDGQPRRSPGANRQRSRLALLFGCIFGRSGLTGGCSGSAEHRREKLKHTIVARGRPVDAGKSDAACRCKGRRNPHRLSDLRSRHRSVASLSAGADQQDPASFWSATLHRRIRLPQPRRGRTRQGFSGPGLSPYGAARSPAAVLPDPARGFHGQDVSSRFLRCRAPGPVRPGRAGDARGSGTPDDAVRALRRPPRRRPAQQRDGGAPRGRLSGDARPRACAQRPRRSALQRRPQCLDRAPDAAERRDMGGERRGIASARDPCRPADHHAEGRDVQIRRDLRSQALCFQGNHPDPDRLRSRPGRAEPDPGASRRPRGRDHEGGAGRGRDRIGGGPHRRHRDGSRSADQAGPGADSRADRSRQPRRAASPRAIDADQLCDPDDDGRLRHRRITHEGAPRPLGSAGGASQPRQPRGGSG